MIHDLVPVTDRPLIPAQNLMVAWYTGIGWCARACTCGLLIYAPNPMQVHRKWRMHLQHVEAQR